MYRKHFCVRATANWQVLRQRGFVASLIPFTVFPVTHLSDQYGRKPVILLGALGIAFATSIIGVSTALWMLVLSRALGGLAGGYGTAIRVMICEIAGEARRSAYLNYASIAYCAGQILGQAFGGILAHPERRFKLFDSPFWYSYPFALPCFVGGGYAAFWAVTGFLTLRETVPLKKKVKARGEEAGETSPLLPPADDKVPEPSPSVWSVLNLPLVSLFISQVLFCLIVEAFFAVFPLYSFTPVELGGLGLSEAQIGVQMACRAVIFLSLLSLYPRIEARIGVLRSYQIAFLSWPCTIMIIPFLNVIARRGGEGSFLWYFTLVLTMISWSINSLGWSKSI
jgi:MFS family permease